MLESLVVEGEPLDQELAEARRGPLAKLCSTLRSDPVADGEDGVEAVVIDETTNATTTLSSNYPESPDGSRRFELPVRVDPAQMLADRADVLPKEAGDQHL